jgi:hypothetical protein
MIDVNIFKEDCRNLHMGELSEKYNCSWSKISNSFSWSDGLAK